MTDNERTILKNNNNLVKKGDRNTIIDVNQKDSLKAIDSILKQQELMTSIKGDLDTKIKGMMVKKIKKWVRNIWLKVLKISIKFSWKQQV